MSTYVLFFCILALSLSSCSHKKRKLEPPLSAEAAFTRIYTLNGWGQGTMGESTSGPGSLVCYAKPYMEFLQRFLEENRIQSVVDIGCGDWEFSQHIDWNGIRYLGLDVVKQVIERNIQRFEKPETCTFVCADVTAIDLPKADLLLCKDVIHHLKNEDIFALQNQLSKYKYCLITHDIINPFLNLKINKDIKQRGECRIIDLTLPPFNLKGKKVLAYIADRGHMKEVLLIDNSLHLSR